ncbi:MAG: hypothetical protein IIZ73_07975, partial [Ruminococcus sp.]|nr:hypothetical protein [Ruminococcus sp.]
MIWKGLIDMKNYTRVFAGLVALLMAAGSTGMFAYAADASAATVGTLVSGQDKDGSTEAADDKAEQAKTTNGFKKDETVYVITDANGKPSKKVVTSHLLNPDGKDTIPDASDLTDIENTKNDDSFTGSGSSMKWNADGDDIYYKGYSDAALPVDIAVSYKLDGRSISPSELAGKSGKVTVRYDYTNNSKKTVKIDGRNVTMYTPFLMATGILLDGERFKNVEVTNGKVVSEGERENVIGYAMPGLKES